MVGNSVGTMAVMKVCPLAAMSAGWLVECSAVMKVASMVLLLVVQKVVMMALLMADSSVEWMAVKTVD
jgi:hypothetical protein